jgi:catechol 2,3-dioxygenase-like lactoylglutathione lyase family enzyme
LEIYLDKGVILVANLKGVSGTRHVGLVCSNIERSIIFYESLGFICENLPLEESGPLAENLVGIENVIYKTVKMHLERDDLTLWRESGFRLELVEYISPKPQLLKEFDNNVIGKIHLCFTVEDLDLTVKTILNHGGYAPFNSTLDITGTKKYIYAFDPDKTPLELAQTRVD